ncbi:adenosylcobalamin-dependent ribonucleoside-diphosphate reductase [Nanoarchaeota archaeon]
MLVQKYEKPVDLKEKLKSFPEPVIPQRGLDILQSRYLRKDEKGNVVETAKELLFRVAHVIGSADSLYEDFDVEETTKKFFNLMAKGFFIPNSPTLRGAGLNINLSACYVLPIEDNRHSIFNTLRDAADVQAFGGGTGFNFSNLRPRGALINTTKGVSSGPISFMETYDIALGKTIAQGGTRQGANMGILNYNHGDVESFIVAKNKEGRLTNFNISVGCTEEFMEQVLEKKEYSLIDHKGREIKKVNAKDVFDSIVKNAWISGDPGIIFLDRIENDNPTPNAGKIEATNPCGEQPLLPYESCNLGSINLRKFVEGNQIDYELLREVVENSVHFLDNVIDINKYPLEKIEESVKANRKIGLGVMGFADMLAALSVSYDSEEAVLLAEKIMKCINDSAKKSSNKLAETRGKFPNWKDSIYDPESVNFKGENIKLRNATRTTIAPTGTISNLAGVEGGIEPMFSLVYRRRSIFDEEGNAKFEFFIINSEFERVLKEEEIYSEGLIEKVADNRGTLKGLTKPESVDSERWEEIKKIFATSQEISYETHIKMQAAFQKHVDNAVSKTINLPNSATEEDVRNAYLLAYKTGIKGITVYRDGCKKGQVLSVKSKEKIKEKIERPVVVGTTVKQSTPHGKAFITFNCVQNSPMVPHEAFINIGKGGKDIPAIAEGFGRLISIAFNYNVPLNEIVEQLRGISGETQTGFGSNRISSLPDAIAKGLSEAYFQLNGREVKLDLVEKKTKNSGSGNLCPECGSPLMLVEGCQKCICGYSKC